MIALKPIGHAVGTIFEGSTFEADQTTAEAMIATGEARPFGGFAWRGLEWAGDTVVILASGQSLKLADCELVREWREAAGGRRVIAINTTFMLAPWADVLYACDAPWWNQYIGEARRVSKSEFWTQDKNVAHEGVKHIESRPGSGLNKTPGVINQGRNGGYQAINLAYQAGAKKIILLGFDMHGKHWHSDHPKPLTGIPNYLFELWIQAFDPLAHDIKKAGVEVVNCTRSTRLTCFRLADLKEALA
jgi:predicted peroxiredoxin